MLPNSYVDVAIHAAKKSGSILIANLGHLRMISLKDKAELTTNVDLESEQAITTVLKSSFPDHRILGEEGGLTEGGSNYLWIIDPLDGTTNYIYGYPAFCISIALTFEEEILLGVVYNPLLDEVFMAQRGIGTFLNGLRINVSQESEISNAFLSTGFPYSLRHASDPLDSFVPIQGQNCQAESSALDTRLNINDSQEDASIQAFLRVMTATKGKFRRGGSAVLDLCYVAAGRFDGYWHPELQVWDIVAASLILTEAGGEITDYYGNSLHLNGKTSVVATNQLIHAELQAITGGNQ